MKVLFVSESPINKQVSIGNTFLDVFEDIKDAELYSFYMRKGMPDTSRIKGAFRITDRNLLKNCFTPKKIGEEVDCSDSVLLNQSADNKFETFVKKKRPALFFFLRTLLWKILPWRHSGLKKYINDLKPDIIFTLLTNEIILNDIILYIKEKSSAKLVLYAWDDTYGFAAHSKSAFSSLAHCVRRRKMRKVVCQADKMYVISPMQKDEYEKSFSNNMQILTKSDSFEKEIVPKKVYNYPLKILYTGNLSLGRWKSVSYITEALKKLNTDKNVARLDIYSSTVLTGEQISAVSDSENSFFHGEASIDTISRLQSECDILVFAEGFEEEYKNLVRLSFSTKLVDYFKSANPIIAVGPPGISSMDYLADNDAALICNKPEDVYNTVSKMVNNTSLLNEYAQKSFNCGKRNHNSLVMSRMLENDLLELIKAERK